MQLYWIGFENVGVPNTLETQCAALQFKNVNEQSPKYKYTCSQTTFLSAYTSVS